MGHDGLRQLITTYHDAFPDAHFAIDDQVAEGDRVVTRFTMRGTHQGDLAGIAPAGRSVTRTGMLMSTMRDGKIVEDFENFDNLHLLQQLGVAAAG